MRLAAQAVISTPYWHAAELLSDWTRRYWFHLLTLSAIAKETIALLGDSDVDIKCGASISAWPFHDLDVVSKEYLSSFTHSRAQRQLLGNAWVFAHSMNNHSLSLNYNGALEHLSDSTGMCNMQTSRFPTIPMAIAPTIMPEH